MKIVLLGGSLRKSSNTYRVLEVACQQLTLSKVEAEIIDLRKLDLPFCDGSENYSQFPGVETFRRIIFEADGLILATPEYHGSISGVLKNALDLLDEEHIRGKVVALIAVMGGVQSSNALNTLRTVCRQLHAWVIPSQLILSDVDQAFDVNERLKDPAIEQRLRFLLEELVDGARRLKKNPG